MFWFFFLRGVFLPGRLMFGVYLVEGLLLILSPSQFRQPPTGVLRKLVLMRSYFYLFSIFFICSLVNLPKVIILLYYIFSLKKILKNDWYEFIDGVIFNLPIFFIIYFKYQYRYDIVYSSFVYCLINGVMFNFANFLSNLF